MLAPCGRRGKRKVIDASISLLPWYGPKAKCVFAVPFRAVAKPEVMSIASAASFPTMYPSVPRLSGSPAWTTTASPRECPPAPSNAFFALLTLPMATCAEPSVSGGVARKARTFSFASPGVLATWAGAPGRFATYTGTSSFPSTKDMFSRQGMKPGFSFITSLIN